MTRGLLYSLASPYSSDAQGGGSFHRVELAATVELGCGKSKEDSKVIRGVRVVGEKVDQTSKRKEGRVSIRRRADQPAGGTSRSIHHSTSKYGVCKKKKQLLTEEYLEP